MFEVEAKVPISKKEYLSLMSRLKRETKYLGSRINRDVYYDKPKKVYHRIRNQNGKDSFYIKLRSAQEGIESNIEMEWGIKDLPGWRRLLKKLDIKPNIRKTKKTELFKKDGFMIELNEVRLLGYFLEIEMIVENPEKVSQAKEKLLRLFKDLGYNQSQFERRPYLELLTKKQVK